MSHLINQIVQTLVFLWCTFPKLKQGLAVIDSWGFEYKTLGFAWIKVNKRQNPDQGSFLQESIDDVFGVGHYTKSNCEPCLLGVRGKTKDLHGMIQDRTVRSTIVEHRGRHSEKPAEVRKRIERLLGDVPRIELFAREAAPGWDVWGNEVQSYDSPNDADQAYGHRSLYAGLASRQGNG